MLLKKLSLFLSLLYSSSIFFLGPANFSTMDDELFKLTIKAHDKLKATNEKVTSIVTVVDYRMPSNKKRLWVLDLNNKKQLYNIYVSHGKNSGYLNAVSFSNKSNSLKSSLGVFLTKKKYVGKHGLSVRLDGLEKGYNDKSFSRNIVIHGSSYASEKFIKNHKRVGRSLGCFAIDEKISEEVINAIGQNSMLISYSDDLNWVESSKFLA